MKKKDIIKKVDFGSKISFWITYAVIMILKVICMALLDIDFFNSKVMAIMIVNAIGLFFLIGLAFIGVNYLKIRTNQICE
jgi:high-affinity K+ transport system ATPase subunit B